MDTKQFQYEPGLMGRSPSATSSHTARFHSETQSRFSAARTPAAHTGLAAVPSMMLGLMLRGQLADSDKLFLDRLAPHKSITFLIQGNHYLHPEDVPLFPYELIETAIRQKTTAVFTHLFCPSSSRDSHRYKIMTAVVNPESNSPLVFGLFGPESVISEPEIESRFMDTAACFRQAYASAKAVISKLGNLDDPDTPLMVINRASGRLLYLNTAAAEQCDSDAAALIDTEFSEARDALGGLILDKKLQIKNLTESDLNLSVVTVEGTPRTESDNTKLAGFLLQKLREQVEHKDSDSLIAGHDRLLRDIDDLRWILDGDSQSSNRINLLYELDQAVENKTSDSTPEYPIRLIKQARQLYCRARTGSYRGLFEAVLSAHGVATPSAKNTTVTVSEHNSGAVVTIRFTTTVRDIDAEPADNNGWDEFADGLARLVGVDLVHRRVAKENKLLSEITIDMSTDE